MKNDFWKPALASGTKMAAAIAFVAVAFGAATESSAQQGMNNQSWQSSGFNHDHGIDFGAMKRDLNFKKKRKVKLPLKSPTTSSTRTISYEDIQRARQLRCVDCE